MEPRRFTTTFTSARHLSLSWAISIQSIPPTSNFLKIYLNIIFPSTPGSSKWSLSLRFLHQNPIYASPLPHTRYMPRPTYCSRFYHRNNLGEDSRSLSSSLRIFSTPLLPRPTNCISKYSVAVLPWNARWYIWTNRSANHHHIALAEIIPL